MKLEFELGPSLPRLAWCARVCRGEDVVRVRHGSWVESRDDCFFEGAWDGPFDDCRFDEAVTLAGSGGRLVQGAVVFAAPSHPLERIQSIQAGDDLYVSNSFTFLLVEADDEPDPTYPNYFFDFLNHYRSGIRVTEKSIRTKKHDVQLHVCGNIVVKPDLTMTRLEKDLSAPPVDYADYVAQLERTVKRISLNAAHPGRKQVYRLVASISQGYDSTAASVLASRAGCREAVTFRKSGSTLGYVDDSGAVIADYLGLQTTEYERRDFMKLTRVPDAEFYFDPLLMTDRSMTVMEDQLVGSLLVTGRHGETTWSPSASRSRSFFQESTAVQLSGSTLTEFRLRVGFIHLPLPYSGGLHNKAIHRITRSSEMKPWSVGGHYDRPIARRIVEEAGVPRALFARYKAGGDGSSHQGGLLPESERDFLEFYRSTIEPQKSCDPAVSQLSRLYHPIIGNLRRLVGKRLYRSPNIGRLILFLFGDRLHPLWGSKYLYAFHWGFAKIKQRYQSALSNGLSEA